MDKRILITGAFGYIGTHLRKKLIGNNIWYFDRVRADIPHYIRGDLNDYFSLKRTFKKVKPTVVIHLANMVSRYECEETPSLAIDTNVKSALYIAELCREYKSRLIYAGSSEEYGHAYDGGTIVDETTPFGAATSMYSLTKRQGEEIFQYYAEQGHIKATTLRFCMLYGPGEEKSSYRSAISKFINHTQWGDGVLRVHAGTERSWCYIDDAIDAILKVMGWDQPTPYEAFNVGRWEPIATIDLADKIAKIFDPRVRIVQVPIEPTIIPIKRMSYKKIKDVIGWEATTTLDEGLKKIRGL